MASLSRALGRASAGGLPRTARNVALVVVAFALLLLVLPLTPLTVVGLLLLLAAVVTVASAVEIVQAYEKRALTIFGEYRELLEPGLNVVPPFVSRTYRFDMRTQAIDVPPQEAITEDNSPVTADAVVYLRVMDAKRAFLEVDDYRQAVSNLAQTTLRAVIGDLELDDTLSRRDRINERIRRELDGPTDEWGIRVEAVEVREVKPSVDVQNAMEEQTAAERRRRATILEAQGERRSAVETAEGERQSNVIRAQGQKRASVLSAQGDALATVLNARSAEAMGERAIVDRGFDALSGIGEGEATTFVLPQEVTSLVGRYGKRLAGGAAQDGEGLEALEFDAETRELLGLDEIEELIGDGDVGGNGADDRPAAADAGAEFVGVDEDLTDESDGDPATDDGSGAGRNHGDDRTDG